jgi:hypothetical protein
VNDWSALFRSLTADNVDNVDNVEPANASISQKTADNVDIVDNVEATSQLPADIVNIVNIVSAPKEKERATPSDIVNIVNIVSASEGEEQEAAASPLAASLTDLEHHCPDHIEAADWQHAVEDGRRFLTEWGEQATALGWTEADIFGLPSVPPDPRSNWQRLARFDQLGLIWLLRGRPVTSITAERATIATPSGGSVSFYRLRAPGETQRSAEGIDSGINRDQNLSISANYAERLEPHENVYRVDQSEKVDAVDAVDTAGDGSQPEPPVSLLEPAAEETQNPIEGMTGNTTDRDGAVNAPTPATGTTKPSYELGGYARPGSVCELCGKPVGVYRIRFGGQEYSLHRHHADEYVRALADPERTP